MAHSHHHHREHQVAHRRVGHILKHEPAGAKQHAKGHAYSKVTSKTAAEHHDGVHGHKSVKRYKRGGKVKGHQTNIAIVMPHHQQPPGGAPPPGGPMAGGAPPMPMMPPGGPPGGAPGPGGPPMPMPPMHAKGGKVIDGESTKGDLKAWGKRAAKNSYARGGAAKMTAGAATGVGREEQAGIIRRKKK